MNKNIIRSRRALLNRTAKHFNSINRAYDYKKRNCLYLHSCNGGCAIGREVETELARKLQRKGASEGAITNINLFNLLPLRLQKLGQKFLIQIQNLHDVTENWKEKGLSARGNAVYRRILKNYCS